MKVMGAIESIQRENTISIQRENTIMELNRIYLLALALVLAAASQTRAAKVLEFNFSKTDTGAATTTGMGINTGGDFFPTNIRDETTLTNQGQSLGFGGVHGVYVVGTDIPNAPSTLPPGWDGAAARFIGENYARWSDPDHEFTGSFSAYARIYREGLNPLNNGSYNFLGNGQLNNFGWGMKLDIVSGMNAEPLRLDVYLGGELQGDGQEGVFGNGVGPIIENNKWYDIGITYSGTPFDAVADTLKVFVNGELVQTFMGDADFDPKPFGQTMALGMDTFGNEGFPGLYERVILWNEAISDAEMLALMPSAGGGELLGDANNDGVVDIFDVNVVSDNWGTAGPTGDVNDDGIVDIFDVNLISDNWGAMAGGALAVPEPTSIVLIGLTALGLVAARRLRMRIR